MGFCVPGFNSSPLSLTLPWSPVPVLSHWVAWGKSLLISEPQCCPVIWGDSMFFPRGFRGARHREHFLGPHVMVKHTAHGGRWLGCLEDRNRHDTEHRVLLSCSMSPPPQFCPSLGVGHPSVQTRTPWSLSVLAPPLCLVLPSLTSQAVSCVCLCVGIQSHLSTLGIFGKGRRGGHIQELSGLPSLTPSFPRLPVLGSSHFL